MRSNCGLSPRHSISLCLAASAGLAMPARALDCATPSLVMLAGVEHSQWQEFDQNGQSLLREKGALARFGVDASTLCAGIAWNLQWTHSQGTRAYDGVTNTHAPVQTSSRIGNDSISLTGTIGMSERWGLGARWSEHRIARDIQGTGTVLGFPEDYAYGLFALGASYQVRLASPWQLTWQAWVGTSTSGSVSVQLPHADAATLHLGRTRLLESSLVLGSTPTPGRGWTWQTRLTLREESTGAGAARPLLRNGVLVGAASQPEIRHGLIAFDMLAQYRF